MESTLDRRGFLDLVERLASAWGACDAAAAAACFTDDAVYMEPPDQQLFVGTRELEAFFSPLQDGTYFDIHRVWFDPDAQSGVVEFTFGVRGRPTADHGLVSIQLRDGLIGSWTEYFENGPADRDRFVGVEGKTWAWHGGNYP